MAKDVTYSFMHLTQIKKIKKKEGFSKAHPLFGIWSRGSTYSQLLPKKLTLGFMQDFHMILIWEVD